MNLSNKQWRYVLRCICKGGYNSQCPNYKDHMECGELIKEGHLATVQLKGEELEIHKNNMKIGKERYMKSWYKKILDFSRHDK